jgi:hypothetical protein
MYDALKRAFTDSMTALVLSPVFQAGDNVAKIAARLRKRGIRGKTQDAKSCVLAECLKTAYPGKMVAVYPSRIEIGEVVIPINGSPIRDFVNRFDEGRFPSLERKGK